MPWLPTNNAQTNILSLLLQRREKDFIAIVIAKPNLVKS